MNATSKTFGSPLSDDTTPAWLIETSIQTSSKLSAGRLEAKELTSARRLDQPASHQEFQPVA